MRGEQPARLKKSTKGRAVAILLLGIVIVILTVVISLTGHQPVCSAGSGGAAPTSLPHAVKVEQCGQQLPQAVLVDGRACARRAGCGRTTNPGQSKKVDG